MTSKTTDSYLANLDGSEVATQVRQLVGRIVVDLDGGADGASPTLLLGQLWDAGLIEATLNRTLDDETDALIVWRAIIVALSGSQAGVLNFPPLLSFVPALRALHGAAGSDILERVRAEEHIGVVLGPFDNPGLDVHGDPGKELVCTGFLGVLSSGPPPGRLVFGIPLAGDRYLFATGSPGDVDIGLTTGGASESPIDGNGVRCHDLKITPEHVLGIVSPAQECGAGASIYASVELALCAQLTGILSVLRDRTAEHLRTRHQFGRPLGSFQAPQHSVAQMDVISQMVELSLGSALGFVANGDSAIRPSVSVAKALAADHAIAAAERAIHLHGGMGYTWETGLHHLLLRAHQLNNTMGSGRWHQRWLADTVMSRAVR